MKFRYFGFLFVALIIAVIVYKLFFFRPMMPGMGMPEGMVMPAAVAAVVEKPVDVWNEFSGRLEATEKVEIHARVSGAIQKILFQEGAIVKKDQPLFIIDPRPYQAAMQKAEADISQAKAQLEFASNELTRAESLVKTSVITQSKYDERLSAKQTAESNLKSAEAALSLARLNLEYSTIKAPITGRISRAEVTEGNLVDTINPNMTQPLASIVSITPIYGEFNIDEQTYIKFVGPNTANSDVSKIPVEITLAGENAPTVSGVMKSFDNQLDTKSGTIRARAVFDNADGKLLPGMFAKVRLGSTDKKNSILITDRAVGTDQDKKFVLVVNPQNKIEYRPVVLGTQVEGMRVIESGLAAGEKIIVSGLFKYRPDMVVAPQEVPMEGTQNMAQQMQETVTNPDVQKIESEKSPETSAPQQSEQVVQPAAGGGDGADAKSIPEQKTENPEPEKQ